MKPGVTGTVQRTGLHLLNDVNTIIEKCHAFHWADGKALSVSPHPLKKKGGGVV